MMPLRSSILLALFAVSCIGPLARKPAGPQPLHDALGLLAEQLRPERKSDLIRVAVVPFTGLADTEPVLGAHIAETLTTELFRGGDIELVERSQLDKVLTELRLKDSKILDVETVQQVGKVLGAAAIVTGTFTVLDSYTEVRGRLIDVRSGKVLRAGDVDVRLDADLSRLLESKPVPRAAAKGPSSGAAAQTLRTSSNGPLEAQPRQPGTCLTTAEADIVSACIRLMRIDEEATVVYIQFKNLGSRRAFIGLDGDTQGDCGSILTDPHGTAYEIPLAPHNVSYRACALYTEKWSKSTHRSKALFDYGLLVEPASDAESIFTFKHDRRASIPDHYRLDLRLLVGESAGLKNEGSDVRRVTLTFRSVEVPEPAHSTSAQ